MVDGQLRVHAQCQAGSAVEQIRRERARLRLLREHMRAQMPEGTEDAQHQRVWRVVSRPTQTELSLGLSGVRGLEGLECHGGWW